ncbi:UNVERIFIED_CONTAM: hypothetical protein GTU68_042615 [Idotea baltica]|nr:hypothetical protein [Idotea baltica]
MVNKQCVIILDPTEKEERVMSGKFVVGLNPHGEITSLLFPGKVCLEKHNVSTCVSRAFSKAKSLAELVLNLVEEDVAKRKTALQNIGYLNALKPDTAYAKDLLADRVKGLRRMEIESEPFLKEEVMDVTEEESCAAAEAVPEEAASSSSDEEFSPESLTKSLPQIRAAKAMLKKHKADKELERKSFKLDPNNL